VRFLYCRQLKASSYQLEHIFDWFKKFRLSFFSFTVSAVGGFGFTGFKKQTGLACLIIRLKSSGTLLVSKKNK